MFVQVLQGPVADAAKVRRALDRWYDELSSGAEGWLGSTAGVTDDGQLVSLVRFDSEDSLVQDVRYHDLRDPWLLAPR